jgi:hypothetical protein
MIDESALLNSDDIVKALIKVRKEGWNPNAIIFATPKGKNPYFSYTLFTKCRICGNNLKHRTARSSKAYCSEICAVAGEL